MSQSHTCHNVSVNNTNLWYERLGHLNFKTLSKIASASLVSGLPSLEKKSPSVCGPCKFGKQLKSTHKTTTHVATSKVLELLHMDLMGPMPALSVGSKNYIFVCVDDFSRYIWVDFLKEKYDTFNAFKKLCVKLKNEKNCLIGKIMRIQSDHDREFENTIYAEFCDRYGISHEFSVPKTP